MHKLREQLQDVAWNVPGARDKASCMQLALIAMFDPLGIDWRTRTKQMHEMNFQCLIRFYKKNGHSHLNSRVDRQLHHWCSRVCKKKSSRFQQRHFSCKEEFHRDE
jgi:hypothetical protein